MLNPRFVIILIVLSSVILGTLLLYKYNILELCIQFFSKLEPPGFRLRRMSKLLIQKIKEEGPNFKLRISCCNKNYILQDFYVHRSKKDASCNAYIINDSNKSVPIYVGSMMRLLRDDLAESTDIVLIPALSKDKNKVYTLVP